MQSELKNKFEKALTTKKPSNIKQGDTVEVDTVIRDGDKQRIQKFRGLVIAINGKGSTSMFTVRKISYGVGVENKFPFNSQNVGKVTVLRNEKVRRAKLYFMRERVGKSAMRIRKGRTVLVDEHEDEVIQETVTETPVVPVETK